MRSSVTGFCLIALTLLPTRGLGDTELPPRLKQHVDTIEKIRRIVERLRSEERVPVAITYSDHPRSQIIVPKQFAAQAAKVGLIEQGSTATTIESGVESARFRVALAGLALSACFIAAGIFFARRGFTRHNALALIVGIAGVLIAAGSVFCFLYEIGPIPSFDDQERIGLGIDVQIYEHGDTVRFFLPNELNPEWSPPQGPRGNPKKREK